LKSIERFVQAGFPVSNIHIALVEGGKDLNDIGQKRAVETIYAAQPLTLKLLLQFSKKGAESDLLKKLV
jgi:hypothetical protein